MHFGVVRKSSTWTAPNNGNILEVEITYDENDDLYDHIHGGIYNADTDEELWRTNRDVSNKWVNIYSISESVQSILVYVFDRGWGETQSITGEEVIYCYVEAQDRDVAAYSTDSTGKHKPTTQLVGRKHGSSKQAIGISI